MPGRIVAAAIAWLAVVIGPALAQQGPVAIAAETFWQGVQSALVNSLAGLTHLAAALALGCLAAAHPAGMTTVAVFVAAALVGAGAHIGERTVANADVFAALSVAALGLLIFRKNSLRRDIAIAVAAVVGLLSGYLLGAAIAAAPRQAMLGYLAGLAAIQLALSMAVMLGLQALAARPAPHLLAMRVIGAFAVGAGAAVLLRRYGAGF